MLWILLESKDHFRSELRKNLLLLLVVLLNPLEVEFLALFKVGLVDRVRNSASVHRNEVLPDLPRSPAVCKLSEELYKRLVIGLSDSFCH